MKTVTVDNVKRPVLQIATGAAGAMASKVIAPHIPGGAYGKIGLAIGLGVLTAVTSGKSASGKAIQAAAIGGGIIQFVEGTTQLIAPKVAAWADAGEPSKLKELVKRSVGLAAPNSSYYEELLFTGTAGQQSAGQTLFPSPLVPAIAEPAGV